MKARSRLVTSLLAVWMAAAPSAQAESPGWKALFLNRWSEARQAFAVLREGRDESGEGLRGLGWLALLEGDDSALLDSWGSYLANFPHRPEAVALWPLWVECAERLGREADLESLALSIAAHPSPQRQLRDSVKLWLEGRQGLPQPDRIDRWQAIGPFDNQAGLGYLKRFSLEEGQTSLPLEGKDALRLIWHDVSQPGRPFVDVGRLGRAEEETFYAATAVQSTGGSAELTLAARCPVKAWLNGHCVVAQPRVHRATGLDDPVRLQVKLRPGWNTLCLKLAADSQHLPQFRLTLHNSQGAPAFSHCSPQQSDLTLQLDDVSNQVTLPAAAPESRPTGPDAALLEALVEDTQGRSDRAVGRLKEGLAQHPQSALYAWRLSHSLGLDGRDDEARLFREQSLRLFPRLAPAQFESVLDSSQPDEALARLRSLTHKYPQRLELRLKLYRLLSEAGLDDDARRLLLELARHPLNASHCQQVAQLLLREGEAAQALQLLHEARLRFPQDPGLRRLERAERVRQGRLDEALTLAQGLANECNESEDWLALWQIERQAGHPEAALEALQGALRARPQDARNWLHWADELSAQERRQEAEQAVRQAVQLEPGQAAVRDKLQQMRGQKSLLTELTPPLPFDPLSATSRVAASAVMLLDEERCVVYPDGASAAIYRMVVQVNDEHGAASFTRQVAPAAASGVKHVLEVARVYKADGRILDVRSKAEPGWANFPALQPGDKTEVQWRVDTVRKGGLARHFWTGWTFDFGALPIERGRFIVASPAGVDLQVQSHGRVPPVSEKVHGDWRVREWNVEHLAGLATVELGAPERERASWLSLSSISSWKEIVDWYLDLSAPMCHPEPLVREKALELTAGLSEESAKIHRLQRFVAEALRYQSNPFRNSAYLPTPGKKVLTDGFGDCKDKSTLLCALLEAVGIKAHPVLLSTRRNGLTPPLPSPWFNHVIVKIDSSQGPLWVDPTAPQPDLSQLPMDDQGAPALLIQPGNAALETTPMASHDGNSSLRHQRGQLDEQGTLKGRFTLQARGYRSEALRQTLAGIAPGERGPACAAFLSESLGAPCQILEGGARLEGVEERWRPLTLELDYRCPRFARHVGERLIVPQLFGSLQRLKGFARAILQSQGQKLDLIWMRGIERSDVRIQLPPGYHLEAPWHQQRRCGAGYFEVHIFQEKGDLVAHLQARFDTTLVDEAQAQEALGFLQEVLAAASHPTLLRKGHK